MKIARAALAAGLPLVTLHNKGFSKLQKPMTRADATAMNRLCRWIVGEDAAEINYHGMCPENADGLASAAARVERR